MLQTLHTGKVHSPSPGSTSRCLGFSRFTQGGFGPFYRFHAISNVTVVTVSAWRALESYSLVVNSRVFFVNKNDDSDDDLIS